MRNFSEDKKAVVASMGFGGLLNMKAEVMNKKYLSKVLNQVDTERWEMTYPGRNPVKLTVELLAEVLQLSSSGQKVPVFLKDIEVAELSDSYRLDEFKKMKFTEMRKYLLDNEPATAGWKERFVLFVVGKYYCPTSTNVPESWHHGAGCVSIRSTDYNWAYYVFNHLKEKLLDMKQEPSRLYVGGCTHFLKIVRTMMESETENSDKTGSPVHKGRKRGLRRKKGGEKTKRTRRVEDEEAEAEVGPASLREDDEEDQSGVNNEMNVDGMVRSVLEEIFDKEIVEEDMGADRDDDAHEVAADEEGAEDMGEDREDVADEVASDESACASENVDGPEQFHEEMASEGGRPPLNSEGSHDSVLYVPVPEVRATYARKGKAVMEHPPPSEDHDEEGLSQAIVPYHPLPEVSRLEILVQDLAQTYRDGWNPSALGSSGSRCPRYASKVALKLFPVGYVAASKFQSSPANRNRVGVEENKTWAFVMTDELPEREVLIHYERLICYKMTRIQIMQAFTCTQNFPKDLIEIGVRWLMDKRIKGSGSTVQCKHVIMEPEYSELVFNAASNGMFIDMEDLERFFPHSMIHRVDHSDIETVSISLFDKFHWWVIVIFIASQAVEVLGTIVFGNEMANFDAMRRMRDTMSIVAIQGMVEWLHQNGRSFVLDLPCMQITRPMGVVCQSDWASTAFYTLMYIEEWCNTRPVLALPRACEDDLMKWYLNRWLLFRTTNRVKPRITRHINDMNWLFFKGDRERSG